ncbi:hypothetical protein PHSY_003255 [Pseudozyma hubeiensis SY62]|uniref:Uncharacterized protein n=1 Tax=Pseudozyma hubeiensis (strain SY62) TaxID=1305764 RepID=R9P2Z8_PSEHS|nr:hypothetical protein PHSY_003255 [Pseudozyma hubeiensis SY62]GAC95679.1 hypothetical protein PHSY_003255 [Pseudozyma hubeiensis SY62]
MTQTTGVYCNGSVRLSVDRTGILKLGITGSRLRVDQHFWLALDDGQVGRYGDPQQVKINLKGKLTPVWVEQRGKDHLESEILNQSQSRMCQNVDGKMTSRASSLTQAKRQPVFGIEVVHIAIRIEERGRIVACARVMSSKR